MVEAIALTLEALSVEYYLLLLGLLSFFGGTMAVITGGSFLLITPLFVLLGMPVLGAIVLARSFSAAALAAASASFIQQKKIDSSIVLGLFVGAIPGIFLGVYLALQLTEDMLAYFTGLVMLLGLPFLFAENNIHFKKQHRGLLPVVGLGSGLLSSFGGAIGILAPLGVIGACKMPLKKVIYSVRPFEAICSLCTVGAFLVSGVELFFVELVVCVVAGVIGGWCGSKMLPFVPVDVLKVGIATIGLALVIGVFFI